MDFFTITECVKQYISGVVKKDQTSNIKIFGKAILAGGMIAIGASASSVASHSITNVGIARVVAGFIFPVGLMMVILLGAELFTGDCLMVLGVADKKISLASYIRMLCLVYLGNFLGSLVITVLLYFSGQLDYSAGLLGAYTINVALSKSTMTFVKALSSGILCNILVAGAVLMAMCSKDIAGKLLASFFVILAFVTSGFEHSIANMYYISAGLIAKLNPTYVAVAMEHYGLTEQHLTNLNIQNLFVTNLIPVTIGNFLGAVVFLGLPLYYLNVAKKNAES